MSLTIEQIESRASQALEYLTNTDEKLADLKLAAESAEHHYEAAVDARFLALEGVVDQRKARARLDSETLYLDFLKAQRDFDAVSNKRKSEALVIDWLRSLYSARKQGQ